MREFNDTVCDNFYTAMDAFCGYFLYLILIRSIIYGIEMISDISCADLNSYHF